MLGSLNTNDKNVTVIGGGFAGLVAAYHLLNQNYHVTLYEKQTQCGGLIATKQTQYGLVETAAHSFRSTPAILQLCEELGVPLVTAQSKRKFILRDGRMRRFPLSPLETVNTIWQALFGKIKTQDPTMAQWALAHVGPAALSSLITPLVQGIYAAPPDLLDQELAMPSLTLPKGQSLLLTKLRNRKKQAHRAQMMAPRDGMGALIQKLQSFVTAHPKATIKMGEDLKQLPSGNCIVATNAIQATSLLPQPLAQHLATIQYSPLIAATVFYERSAIPNIEGIGVLYSASEQRNSLGILFNSSSFANRVIDDRYVSLTILLGGWGRGDLLDLNDAALQHIITDEMQAVLRIDTKPLAVAINRWPRAIPLYNKQLKTTLAALRAELRNYPGLVLTGNYTGQISLRGMSDQALNFMRTER